MNLLVLNLIGNSVFPEKEHVESMCHLFLIHKAAAANRKFVPDNQSIADCEVLIPKWVRCDSLTGSHWILPQHSFMRKKAKIYLSGNSNPGSTKRISKKEIPLQLIRDLM